MIRNVWVVNNIGKGYVMETIKRKIYKRKDGNFVQYKKKQYKTYYYQPNRKSMGYCIFPKGLPIPLKK